MEVTGASLGIVSFLQVNDAYLMELSPVLVAFKRNRLRLAGGWKTRRTKQTRPGTIPGRERHVLENIRVMVGIKVTLTRVINGTGQLRRTGSVEREEV